MDDQLRPTPIIWDLGRSMGWVAFGRRRDYVGRLRQPAALRVVASGGAAGAEGAEGAVGGAGAAGAAGAGPGREGRAEGLAGLQKFVWRFAVPAGAASWDLPEPREWFVAKYTPGETEFHLDPCRDQVLSSRGAELCPFGHQTTVGLARAKAAFAAIIGAELAESDGEGSDGEGSDDDLNVKAFVEVPDELSSFEARRALADRVLADPDFAGWGLVGDGPDGSDDSDDSDASVVTADLDAAERPPAPAELRARGPDGSTLRFVARHGDPAFGRTAPSVRALGLAPPAPRPPRVRRRFGGQAPPRPAQAPPAAAEAGGGAGGAPRRGRPSAAATEALLRRFVAAYGRTR